MDNIDGSRLEDYFNSRMDEFEKELRGSSSSALTAGAQPWDLTSLAADFSMFKTFVVRALSMLKTQMKIISEGLDEMETRSRVKVLLFHGLREDKAEDLPSKITEVIQKKVGMTDFKRGSIKVCHRLGGGSQGKQRTVLVRFHDREIRAEVWKKKTNLKGCGITMSEFLTKQRHGIFMAARNHFGVSQCWTQEGRITIALPDGSRRKNVSADMLKLLTEKYPVAAAGGSNTNASAPVSSAISKSSPAVSSGNSETILKRTSNRNKVLSQS